MTYAIGKNKVTCSSPGGSYTDPLTELKVVIPGCAQPGTELIEVAPGIELEYCGKCAVEIWRAEYDD